MDYQKLLFAAEIRRLAVELRAEAKEAFLQQGGYTGEDRRIAAMRWEGEYKTMQFVPRAVTEITSIAEQIEPIGKPPTHLKINRP